MKFEYDGKEDARECVAVLHVFDGGDEQCLAVKADGNDVVWFYPDGTVSVQQNGMDEDYKDTVIRKFYPGDKIKITITF